MPQDRSAEDKLLDNPLTRVLQKFPGQKVGQAIGTLGGFALSKNKEQYDLSAPTPLQTIGDISNNQLTAAQKAKRNLAYYTFGEVS